MADTPPARRTIAGLPVVTAEETRSVDEALGKEGIRVEAVVSRVGYTTAELITNELLERLTGKTVEEAVVTVLAGTGNKGAAALVAGRNLAKKGATVNVVLSRPPKSYQGVTREELGKLEPVSKKVYKGYNERAFDQADLLIDGLIGVGLEGKPRASVSLLIKGANFSMKPTVALDIPSGLDATTGVQSPVTIKAAATCVVALPKKGMLGESNRTLCGELWLIDTGIPVTLLNELLDLELTDPLDGADYKRLEAATEETAETTA